MNMNMGSKRQKEQIKKLYQLIEYELDKPEAETDVDLIAECSEYLEELEAGKIDLSDAEILSRLEAIKAQVAEESSATTGEPSPKKKRRPTFLKIWVPIAATFFALFLTVTVVAHANGTTLGKFLSENLKKISMLSKGGTVEDDDISATKAEIATYQSLEEYINSQENGKFLFPQPLPNGIKIKEIELYQVDENHFLIDFHFDNQELKICVKNYYQMDYDRNTYKNREEIESNNLYFYVYSLDSSYLISCQHNGYEYDFKSQDLNLLKQLIKNMKEIEK